MHINATWDCRRGREEGRFGDRSWNIGDDGYGNVFLVHNVGRMRRMK